MSRSLEDALAASVALVEEGKRAEMEARARRNARRRRQRKDDLAPLRTAFFKVQARRAREGGA